MDVIENASPNNTVIEDLDNTIIANNTTPSPTEKQYREFELPANAMHPNTNTNEKTNENINTTDNNDKENESVKEESPDAEANIKEEGKKVFADVIDERGGIFYDLLHLFDDIYVYGRTVIENNYFNFADNADFNLVYPNIYIGNYSTSTNQQLLQSLGITHIISVIPTFNPPFPDKFKYYHISAYDDESQDIKQYFEKSNTFIENVLRENGKILIHCMVGRSRSVSIFLAFLIHIIRGRFSQSVVDLSSVNDVSNEIEYKQFGLVNRNGINMDGVKFTANKRGTENEEENDITRIEFQKPVLNNKYRSFMLYKKESMINEVNRLIEKYEFLQKEIDIFKANDGSIVDTEQNERTINQLKQQFSNNFMIQIIQYIKKYRKEANPNTYFIIQLIDYLQQ